MRQIREIPPVLHALIYFAFQRPVVEVTSSLQTAQIVSRHDYYDNVITHHFNIS